MRLIVMLAAVAVVVMIVRSRRAVEVWHMAADEPAKGP
jgi:hypothetical protein